MNGVIDAGALLPQILCERRVDVALMSEQYRNFKPPKWLSNAANMSAISVPRPDKIRQDASESERHFVWLKSGSITYVSCYFSPTTCIEEYRRRMNYLQDTIRDGMEGDLIVAGDFNARAVKWGMPTKNSKGRAVLAMAARLGLVLVNERRTTIFRRPGLGESTSDMTLSLESFAPRVKEWQVIMDENGSNHQYIVFEVTDTIDRRGIARKTGWNVKKLDTERLAEKVENVIAAIQSDEPNLNTVEGVQKLTEATMQLLKTACKASMLRTKKDRQMLNLLVE
ncbi:uncharacterized protein LOC106636372 [Copidosoma floridanum]|uniref:uncharacterized protein LOC106636372 n=1 Tax=Copidosoma floridanum TaxID=29053 RepID=UPI0006C94762|nr:uncharacterized protein LOC106636372 [Copidosoma floridanum]